VSGKNPTTETQRTKRQFLVHLDPTMIRRIKVLAIDRNVSASSLVQEALIGFLAAAGSCPRKPRDTP
jgi:hypothetical protein